MQIGIPAETVAGETRVHWRLRLQKSGNLKVTRFGFRPGRELLPASLMKLMQLQVPKLPTPQAPYPAIWCSKCVRRSPSDAEAALMQPGATLVGMLNPFYMDKTMMVFGDAKKVVKDMCKAIE